MPASYRNIIDGEALKDAIGNGDFSQVLKKPKREARYIKGYAQQSGIEALANAMNINSQLFKQVLGIETKKLDDYDPYHTQDAKREEFWYSNNSDTEKLDGKIVQNQYDEDTNTFKRSLYSQYGYYDRDFYYEDPFIPTFELFFITDSPFFKEWNMAAISPNTPSEATFEENMENDVSVYEIGNSTTTQKTPLQATDTKKNTGSLVPANTLVSFIDKYSTIDPDGYRSRYELWSEFCNVFFKIFNKEIVDKGSFKNKPYYITKIDGVNLLNKKFIKYGEDKITITLNEDVSMIGWYLAELYNNIVYSYKNQRYAFPENVLRFNMKIVINDMRMFTIPQSSNQSKSTVPVDNSIINNKIIKNKISEKSRIIYTLHDCNFNFFESKNYGDSIEIGGYNAGVNNTPSTISFDIFFKSVTRYSEFPLQNPLSKNRTTINAWEKNLSNENTIEQMYSDDLNRIQASGTDAGGKGYLNQLLTKGAQNVVNIGLNYVDNLETELRELRGGLVNNALQQFRNLTNINKIEPDNVYNKDFNNRISLTNLGKQVASSLLNDLESTVRTNANF